MPRSPNVPRLFGRHHEGRQAQAALEVIAPTLERYERDLIEKAKGEFRAGRRDPNEAILMLAQLVALGDLREDLERQIKRGNRAMERLIDQK